jgi:putative ABC transport system substrate-binding protein
VYACEASFEVDEMAILRLKSNARILLVACALFSAAARPALADEYGSPGLPRIGLLSWSSCKTSELTSEDGEWAYFFEGLQEFGYKPGTNVQIDCRSANGVAASFDDVAAELVKIPVDVIVSSSALGAAAARRATNSISCVGIDEQLFGNAFADPRGNFTGLINYWIDLSGKRLELLKEAVPDLEKVGLLSVPRGLYKSYEARSRRAAKELGLELTFYRISEFTTLEDMFSLMKAQGVQAIILIPDIALESEAKQVADLAIRYRLPTMAWDTKLTQEGFLLAYSTKSNEQKKRLAFYVDRILKGATPQKLPIEQPSSLLLSVNLQTAHSIGAVLPRSIMLMAEDVIE